MSGYRVQGLRAGGGARPCTARRRSSHRAAFESEHRSGGTFGLETVRTLSGATGVSGPAPSRWVIRAFGAHAAVQLDGGEGWREAVVTPDTLDVRSANRSHGLRTPPMELLVLSAGVPEMATLLSGADAPPAVLEAMGGAFRELPRARALMAALWCSIEAHAAPGSVLLTDSLLMTLVGELLEAAGQGRLERSVPGATDRRLHRALEHIEAHLGATLSVRELSAVASMSASGFSRAFRRAFGESVWRYVQGRRAERARELLAGTVLTHAEVAARCGYASSSHLGRSFRARFGVSTEVLRAKGRAD